VAFGDLQEIIDRVIDYRTNVDLDVKDVELVDSDLRRDADNHCSTANSHHPLSSRA
jgi:hypothetical protein